MNILFRNFVSIQMETQFIFLVQNNDSTVFPNDTLKSFKYNPKLII